MTLATAREYKEERDQLAEEMNQLSEAFFGYREGTYSELMKCASSFKEQAQRIEGQQEMIKSQGTRIEQSVMQARARIKRIEELEKALNDFKSQYRNSPWIIDKVDSVINTQDT